MHHTFRLNIFHRVDVYEVCMSGIECQSTRRCEIWRNRRPLLTFASTRSERQFHPRRRGQVVSVKFSTVRIDHLYAVRNKGR
jgi:hypothetical protein